VATARITLVQEKGQQAGILLFHPIYTSLSETIETRRQNIKGYAVGVFRIGDIVDAVLAHQYQDKLIVGIYGESNSTDKSLYGPESAAQQANDLFSITETLEIGGRRWSVHFWPTEAYLAGHSAWQARAILLIGSLFCCILGAFLLAMTGRSYYLNKEVKARTKDLEANQNKLMLTNKTLESSNTQLERTNTELDQYAFVASHDLKSPLQAIKQLASRIKEDCNSILPEESSRHLKTLTDRINRMENLLSDLLGFSRISREEYAIEDIELRILVERAVFFNAIPE
jgi:signal transduction histidine kinase